MAARSLRDNPGFLAITADPLARFDLLYRSFEWVVGDAPEPPVAARRSGCVVGIAAASPPGHCVGFLLPPEARLLDPPADDASADERYWYRLSVDAIHDLDEPHWHVGPVGVEPGFQGMGIGRAVMEALCARLDERGGVAWLETDKPENVRFYTELGFEIAEETTKSSSTTTWYMRRGSPSERGD